MRTIIAGSRTILEYKYLLECLEKSSIVVTTVISGGARGPDSLGEWYAKKNSLPLEVFPAEWSVYGKSAGFIRNELMAEHAEACIILWDGKSSGSKHMMKQARKLGIPVEVFVNGEVYEGL